MADISKITLPSGTTYDIKDSQARSDIQDLKTATTAGMHFKGITTTNLTDGATTSPIVIDSSNYTPQAGDIVIVGTSGTNGSAPKEFVWTGSKWSEFGSTGSLKGLAFKDNASGTYVGVKSASVSVSSTNATVSPAASGDATYTPAGSISGIAWTGSSTTSTGKFTPAGSVTTSNKTFAVTGSAVPQNGTANYTPAGSVSTPTISVKTAGSTTTIKNPTKQTVAKTVVAAAPGTTAPSNNITYYAVSGETLSLYQLGYTTGDSITTSDVTVKNGDAAYQSSQPTFTGTGTMLTTATIKEPTGAFSGTEGNISVTGTPNGSITNQGTFTGTGARLVTSNVGAAGNYGASITTENKTVTVS